MMYDIWMEGYCCTVNEGVAQFICQVEACSFQEACDKADTQGKFAGFGIYDNKRLSLWGCKLFDNEDAARKTFG